MDDLIQLAKHITSHQSSLPFSVYSPISEQIIANVPIIKPLLVFVLNGVKQIGGAGELECPTGSFLFLPNSPTVDMRNIPGDEEYFAILIEFDHEDFEYCQTRPVTPVKYLLGEINPALSKVLAQYMEFSVIASPDMLKFRKKELLEVIYQSGYHDVCGLIGVPSLSHQVEEIISHDITDDWTVGRLADKLFMSESTLRRKLRAENTSVQDIRSRTRLGAGLHLIQASMHNIGVIAEKCGYQSQSKFTQQFKSRFGVTPSELRRTRMLD